MATSKGIEEFAKAICLIRDEAVSDCDTALLPHSKTTTAMRWKAAGLDASTLPLAKEVIADGVAAGLFFLLMAIDNGRLKLTFTADDGAEVDLGEEGKGELAGWFVGPEGWLAAHLRQSATSRPGR